MTYRTLLLGLAATAGLASAAPEFTGVGSSPVFLEGDSDSDVDGRVRFEGTQNGGLNGGGEFSFSSVTGRSFGNFQTFCLEINESISPGSEYNFRIATATRSGGAGGGSPDPLDARTAALYEAFANGNLMNYEYGDDASGGLMGDLNRRETAAALQAAIWELEDERTVETTSDDSDVQMLANFYIDMSQDLADAGFGSGVRVLNLFNADNSDAQDVLVLIPLPQAGAMASLALGGLAIRRRRSN